MLRAGRLGKAPRARRVLLISLAILSLAASLVTRYTAAVKVGPDQRISITAESDHAKTQHLIGHGFEWTAPIAALVMLVVPRAKKRTLPPVFSAISLHSEEWLYNRPPPFC